MDALASTLRQFEVRVPGAPPGSPLTLTHSLFQTWRRVVQKMKSAIHRISIRETNYVIRRIAPFARLSYLTFKSCTWFASPLSCLREYFFSRMSANFLLFGSLTQNGLLGAETVRQIRLYSLMDPLKTTPDFTPLWTKPILVFRPKRFKHYTL